MNYPGIKKTYQKTINYKNRGMDLEALINDACKYYIENDIAIIYKKPTPIGIVKINYELSRITDAYFKAPSTLDYNGIYKGKYIEFDAKACLNTTSFPLNNIHNHQIEHIKRIIKHGGICFLIISMNSKVYLYKGEDLIKFINESNRKSIPYSIIDKCYELKYNYNKGIDFIEGINNCYKELI